MRTDNDAIFRPSHHRPSSVSSSATDDEPERLKSLVRKGLWISDSFVIIGAIITSYPGHHLVIIIIGPLYGRGRVMMTVMTGDDEEDGGVLCNPRSIYIPSQFPSPRPEAG
jgi:hypothetical protein